MPRKPLIPAAVADALTEPKPPSASARAVSVLSGESAPDTIGDKDIETITAEILALQSKCGEAMLEIGKRLIVVKERLPHGEWLPWLERVSMSKRLAQRFMQLAREWGNASTLTHLGMSKALSLLALPEGVRDEFITEGHVVNGEEKSVIDMSAKELADAIKARKEAEAELLSVRQQLEETERRLDNSLQRSMEMVDKFNENSQSLAIAQKTVGQTQRLLEQEQQKRIAISKELAALKAKPVDVAVEKVVDPEALEQARKEVREKMQMDLDFARSDADAARQSLQSAKADAEKAETARKAAEKALDDANKAAKDAAQDAQNARQELARVKAEKAPIGDKDLSLFAVLFEQTQAAVNQMHGILLKQDSGRQEQMRKSLSALADAIRKKAVQ